MTAIMTIFFIVSAPPRRNFPARAHLDSAAEARTSVRRTARKIRPLPLLQPVHRSEAEAPNVFGSLRPGESTKLHPRQKCNIKRKIREKNNGNSVKIRLTIPWRSLEWLQFGRLATVGWPKTNVMSMRKFFRRNARFLVGVLWVGLTLPLSAATIYDNSVNDLKIRFHPGTLEVGDEIILAGTERYLTQFDFEYFGTNNLSPGNIAFAGPVEARVRFYINDGAPFSGYASPGTMFYDSGWFGGFGPTPRNTLVFTVSGGDFPSTGLYMPASDMTWSVQFRNMGASDDVGVDLYSPPVVGSSVPGTGFVQDYWENN